MIDTLFKIAQTLGLYTPRRDEIKTESKVEPKISKPPEERNLSQPQKPIESISQVDNKVDPEAMLKKGLTEIQDFYNHNQNMIHLCGGSGLVLGGLYHSKVAKTGLVLGTLLFVGSLGNEKLKRLKELEQINETNKTDNNILQNNNQKSVKPSDEQESKSVRDANKPGK